MERFGGKEDRRVVGGVDTHKDLHVAAVVDEQDRVLASQCFPTTRHGYKQMLAWMRSFGSLQRVGVEATGTYGAGLLRYLQKAGIEVLEVTTPDRQDRRKRGKNDDWMPRTPPMRPLPASERSRRRAVTAWSRPCASSRPAGRRRSLPGASRCR